jgi:hypothetical protein
MYAGGRLAGGGLRPQLFLLKFFLILAFVAFAANLRRRGGRHGIRRLHAHHIVGDAVRLMLKLIIWLSDHELSLKDTGLRRQSVWVRRKERDLAQIP